MTEPRTITTNRDIKKEWMDPQDGQVCVPAVGDAVVKIGDGTATMLGKSPRMAVLFDEGILNSEQTVYVKGNDADNIDLRPKSDHYCVETGDFGGYIVNFSWENNKVCLRKEETHDIGYSDRINEKSIQLPRNKFIGLRASCYNVDNDTKVRLEAYVDENADGNWKRITEGTDDGSWKGKPYCAKTTGSAVRVNNNSVDSKGVQLKDYTIKEI